jgi:hypothetical protein
MNSSNHLIYPDYPSTANIHDARHTGAGKTRHVCDKMNKLIPEGQCFIYISSSYDTIDEVAKKIDESNQLLIFKGKTQEGMCEYWRDYQTLNECIKPLYICNKCDFKDNCDYLGQFDKLGEMKNSGSGFVIFTVKENLPTVLKKVSKTHPYIIIDDASLSDITYPTLTVSEESLIEASNYLNQGVIYSELDKAISLLLEGKFEDVKRFVRDNIEYKNEHNYLKEMVSPDLISGKKIPNLKILDSLLDCTNIYEYNDYYQKDSRIYKVASSNLSKLQKYRIIYLNATADSNDRQTMLKFRNFETITKEIEVNPNYHILQIVDARYSKTSLNGSNCRIPKELNLISKITSLALEFIGIPLLLMTHKSIYDSWCKREDVCITEGDYEFVKYFGSDSKATNKYRSFQISVIIGTPILPGEYYIHPSRDCSIIKDGGYPESVLREEIDSDSRGLIHQMIGRTFREDKDNPDCLKLIILFSNIELGDIGATVERYRLDNKEQNKAFYSRVKELAGQAYEEPIIAKAFEELDQILSQSPSLLVTLNKISTDVCLKCGGLLSRNKIAKRIEKKYLIEERINPKNRKPSKYIVSKIGVQSVAGASIKDISCPTS